MKTINNVIKIDFSDLPDELFKYSECINITRKNIEKDLLKFYPNISFGESTSLSDKLIIVEIKL